MPVPLNHPNVRIPTLDTLPSLSQLTPMAKWGNSCDNLTEKEKTWACFTDGFV